MRTKINGEASERVLNRILDAFARELIDASEEEILEAAKDLGMNPGMKGSAAFLGVIHATPRRLADLFDIEELKRMLLASGQERLVSERRAKALLEAPVVQTKSRSRPRRSRRSSARKPSSGK